MLIALSHLLEYRFTMASSSVAYFVQVFQIVFLFSFPSDKSDKLFSLVRKVESKVGLAVVVVKQNPKV